MRFLHTADWHIGKKLNDFDLLEDQQAVFEQLVETADTLSRRCHCTCGGRGYGDGRKGKEAD